jgi:hypothetical protein
MVELRPTAINLLIPISGVSKCEIIDLFDNHSGFSSIPKFLSNVDLPLPELPTIILV